MTGTPKSQDAPRERGDTDASAGSFPASDPPSATGIVGPRREKAESAGPADQSDQIATPHGRVPRREAEPRGHPTSDRHRSETAHHAEHTAHKTERR